MSFDARIVQALNAFVGRSAFSDTILLFVASQSAYLLGAVGLLAVWMLPYDLEKRILIGACALGSALFARFGMVGTIYRFYKRPRPHDALPLRSLFTQKVPSFPSGHAAFFFALGGVIFCFMPLQGAVFLIAATVMCIARVAIGLHYPSDILGGMVIGITAALLAIGVVSFTGLL